MLVCWSLKSSYTSKHDTCYTPKRVVLELHPRLTLFIVFFDWFTVAEVFATVNDRLLLQNWSNPVDNQRRPATAQLRPTPPSFTAVQRRRSSRRRPSKIPGRWQPFFLSFPALRRPPSKLPPPLAAIQYRRPPPRGLPSAAAATVHHRPPPPAAVRHDRKPCGLVATTPSAPSRCRAKEEKAMRYRRLATGRCRRLATSHQSTVGVGRPAGSPAAVAAA